MTIKEEIREFLMQELKKISNDEDVEYLRDDALLIEDGIIDSLMILSLLAFLEEKFGISLPSGEFDPERFETLEKIADLVALRTS